MYFISLDSSIKRDIDLTLKFYIVQYSSRPTRARQWPSAQMSITDASILSSRATSTAADRLIRNQKQIAHVRQLWIFLGSVLAFLTLVNVIRRLLAWLTPVTEPHSDSESKISIEKINDQESNIVPHRKNASTIQRSLAAVESGFKILFFRWRAPFGLDFTVSVIEQAFIVIYIVAMLIWLLVDSTFTGIFEVTRKILIFFESTRSHGHDVPRPRCSHSV